jgi:hypothetical protein
VDVCIHAFLALALFGGELASRPIALFRGKDPQYPLYWTLSGLRSRCRQRGRGPFDPSGTRTPTSRSSSSWPVVIPTALSHLLVEHYMKRANFRNAYIVFLFIFSWLRTFQCPDCAASSDYWWLLNSELQGTLVQLEHYTVICVWGLRNATRDNSHTPGKSLNLGYFE